MANFTLNLTQHDATPEQVEAGVIEIFHPQSSYTNKVTGQTSWGEKRPAKDDIRELLTFSSIPTQSEMTERAEKFVQLARLSAPFRKPNMQVMIEGAPFFMPVLELALREAGFMPVYAFSQRVVEEKDGLKTEVFKHLGFIEGTVQVPSTEKKEEKVEDFNGDTTWVRYHDSFLICKIPIASI